MIWLRLLERIYINGSSCQNNDLHGKALIYQRHFTRLFLLALYKCQQWSLVCIFKDFPIDGNLLWRFRQQIKLRKLLKYGMMETADTRLD